MRGRSPYAGQSWMMRDLREGKIDAVFGDGVRLSFWLGGPGNGELLPLRGRVRICRPNSWGRLALPRTPRTRTRQGLRLCAARNQRERALRRTLSASLPDRFLLECA